MTPVRNFMEDNQTKVWAAQLGFNGNFTVAEVRLDVLESLTRQSGKSSLAEIYLTPQEQRRFFEFTYGKRQNEWLGGRICAKYAANQLLQPTKKISPTEWQNWTVVADEQGKPYLKPSRPGNSGPSPEISISHSSRLAVAIACQAACGIDIQKIVSTTVKVQNRFSTLGERSLLENFPGREATDEAGGLTLLWSAKEAVRKAVSVRPLLYFTEIKLEKITVLPSEDTLLLDFVCQRDTIAAHHSTKFLQVMAMLHENFALALTIANNR